VKNVSLLIVVAGIMLGLVGRAAAVHAADRGRAAVSKEEASKWLRWLIPLPKEVSIAQKLRLPKSEVKVRLRPGAGEIETQAASRLAKLLGKDITDDRGSFEILVGVCDAKGKLGDVTVPQATRLAKLPHSKQAYYIGPVGDNRLVVTALNEKGIVYGVMTLQTLIEPKLADGRVAIPLMMVTDWPDMADRGRAGGVHYTKNDLPWFASVKMSLLETGPKDFYSLRYRRPEEGGPTGPGIDTNVLEFCRLNAIKVKQPLIYHLDSLRRFGIYGVYPDLQGKKSNAPCTSNAKLVPLLADLMMYRASQQPGVIELSCWLTEHHTECACDQCKDKNQYVAEAQAFLDAWNIARKKYPELQISILLTQGSYSVNDKILAILPPEVGATYYDGGRTYGYGATSREPMVYPLLQKHAAAGGRIGIHSVIESAYCNVTPWSSPHFVKFRMNGFVDRKVSQVKTYSRLPRQWCPVLYDAQAEWLWNAKGRSEREFALAWATRKGLENPEEIADWMEMMGPVSWNVYGSGTPFLWFWGYVDMLLGGRIPPHQFGVPLFRFYKDVEDFDRDLAVTEKALALIKRQDQQNPDVQHLVDETLAVQGYIQMTRGLYVLGGRLAKKAPLSDAEKAEMGQSMDRLLKACAQTTSTLKRWAKRAGSEGRARQTIMFTEKAAITIGDALTAHGLKTDVKKYLSGEVSTWTSELDESMGPKAAESGQ